MSARPGKECAPIGAPSQDQSSSIELLPEIAAWCEANGRADYAAVLRSTIPGRRGSYSPAQWVVDLSNLRRVMLARGGEWVGVVQDTMKSDDPATVLVLADISKRLKRKGTLEDYLLRLSNYEGHRELRAYDREREAAE